MDNEVENFLNGLKTEAPDPFKTEEKDPFAAVPKEKEIEKKEDKVEEGGGDDDADDKPLPFHKDPKVMRFIQKEVAKLTGTKQTEVKKFVEDTGGKDNEDIIKVLTGIIGNDTPEKIAAVQYLAGVDKRATDKVLAQMQAKEEAARQEEVAAQEELTQGFEAIEETYGVDITSDTAQAIKTRNDFVDFIKRVSPKNEDGEVTQFPDLEETFALFQEVGEKKKTSTRAKELASRSIQRTTEATPAVDIKDNSWKAVDKMFSKIKQ